MKSALFFVASLLFVLGANGQQLPSDQEQLLLPVPPDRVMGALGSVWDTSLTIANTADMPITVWGYQPSICNILCSTVPDPIPARTTIFTGIISDRCTPAVGRILVADRSMADNLFMTLRSRDTSRDALAWGSIVPVVRTRDRFTRPFSIVDVPVSARFRALLRLYAVGSGSPSARVRIYAVVPDVGSAVARPDTLLTELTPSFALAPTASAPFCPAYTEIALSQVALQNASRLRIEVIPGESALQYWGFVSVTNNDTQEVSIISPR